MSKAYPSIYLYSCSISFFNVLQFSKYRSFTSSVKFIPRYFILIASIINGVVFLISSSDRSLLVYRNITDFHILILYPATLLKSFSSSNIFFGAVFRVFQVLCHLRILRVLLLPFQFGCFLFIYCLIAMASTFNSMFNRSGDSGHLCFVPDLRGKAFSFSTLSMILVVNLLYEVFIMLRCISFIPLC